MTPDEIAIKFINEHNMPIQTDGRNYRALVAMIAETQAVAVAAEREACASEAHRIVSNYFDLADTRRATLSNKIAAAIRARK